MAFATLYRGGTENMTVAPLHREDCAMGLPNGVHHLAICTKDIKSQIEFYTQVVGMDLCALYWMHGDERTFHGFVRMGNSSIAFVQSPEIGEIQPVMGVRPSPVESPRFLVI